MVVLRNRLSQESSDSQLNHVSKNNNNQELFMKRFKERHTKSFEGVYFHRSKSQKYRLLRVIAFLLHHKNREGTSLCDLSASFTKIFKHTPAVPRDLHQLCVFRMLAVMGGDVSQFPVACMGVHMCCHMLQSSTNSSHYYQFIQ